MIKKMWGAAKKFCKWLLDDEEENTSIEEKGIRVEFQFPRFPHIEREHSPATISPAAQPLPEVKTAAPARNLKKEFQAWSSNVREYDALTRKLAAN